MKSTFMHIVNRRYNLLSYQGKRFAFRQSSPICGGTPIIRLFGSYIDNNDENNAHNDEYLCMCCFLC